MGEVTLDARMSCLRYIFSLFYGVSEIPSGLRRDLYRVFEGYNIGKE
jgi:hypothetical protein